MASANWEFWIDVGGTFTDTLARSPDGKIRRYKLLSSGVFKGRVGAGSTRNVVVDRLRGEDPSDFWSGWQFAIVDERGIDVDSCEITAFDRAEHRFHLRGLRDVPQVGATYELRGGLEAPVVAIRYMLQLPLAEKVPPIVLRLGTTRGTNALITRTGARTALATTRGFGDVLEIGYQARPRLFDLTVHKPPTLASAVVEVDERMTHDGEALLALQESALRQKLQALRDSGIESLAIALLHADRYGGNEDRIAEIAREVGFSEISVSHDVAPLPKLIARTDTTVLDAYLNPVLRDYVVNLAAALPGSHLRMLTSAGGLVAAEEFRGKDSLLSGPAGGVVGFASVAKAAGYSSAIGFDMGGTSTDVARFDGRYELEYETQKAGVRLVTPSLAIETVAAGGGSICRYDGVKLVVGPESAGADPGPACYGRGGPLTVTDCNLMLGRVVAERFPFPLDRAATEQRLREIAVQLPTNPSLDVLAAGFLRIANANMAAAIRLVTVAKGVDPADYLLVAFGSAAPQHACAVARELGIREILVHPDAGVLSAVGVGLADVTRHRSQGIERALDGSSLKFVRELLNQMEREAAAEVASEGVPADKISATRLLDIRYEGIDSFLTIPWPADDGFASKFEAVHRARYGYVQEGRPLEIAAAHVEVVGQVATVMPRSTRATTCQPKHDASTAAYFDDHWQDVPRFERTGLVAGDQIVGPAVVSEPMSTTVVEPGWVADVLTSGELLLTTSTGAPPTGSGVAKRTSILTNPVDLTSPDPVFLEVFNNLLANIASQMGVTLRNTAISVNVKERLDFSCAVFTPDGRLVANAPHVPVHLGAMEETVRQTLASNAAIEPGDVFVTNDPYAGGSHLPDITVITPVHDSDGRLLFVTANRAHHAEIGGITPGSMPPFSKSLAEEGVLIRNMQVVRAGVSRFDELRCLLSDADFPSRNVEINLADIEAQIAANRQGADDLLALVGRYSRPVVAAYMEFVQDAGEQKVRQSLARLGSGTHDFIDYLETANGECVPIVVRFTIHDVGSEHAATIDFTGTGPVLAGNLNANRAIVTAAVVYVLRLLVDEDIPLNHGVLRSIDLILPECMLNPRPGATPSSTPAVASGNVETSQRVVDVLLGALGLAGASQGTMNNLLFGDDTFGYYETICGGSGATADGPGASAVQVHMTNTRSTDPEILERRFPVRVQEFSIRRGSGGNGRNTGGDGTVRKIEFLRPLTLSLISQRRGPHPPYGMAGGKPGALGRNVLARSDGRIEELPGIIQLSVEPGDVLEIRTPGGGGFGSLDSAMESTGEKAIS